MTRASIALTLGLALALLAFAAFTVWREEQLRQCTPPAPGYELFWHWHADATGHHVSACRYLPAADLS